VKQNAVRVPLPQHRFARMQIASSDNLSNAYLAYALIIFAALEGLERGEELPAAVDGDWEKAPILPESLGAAIAAAKNSDFIKRSLPKSVLDSFLQKAEEMLLLDRQDKTSLFNEQFECF
jgi:glutamine synthetase